MIESPFIKLTKMQQNNKEEEKGSRPKKIKASLIKNPAMQTLFKHGIGDKFMKAIYDTKDYPDAAVIGESIYLDY